MKHYTLFDVAAWTLNGLIIGLLCWFMSASYSSARQLGYTADAREHMANLMLIYNSSNEVPSEPIPLSMDMLK